MLPHFILHISALALRQPFMVTAEGKRGAAVWSAEYRRDLQDKSVSCAARVVSEVQSTGGSLSKRRHEGLQRTCVHLIFF